MINKFKALFLYLVIIVLVLSQFATSANAVSYKEPQIIGQSAILINAKSGQILWGKNESLRMAPASTTKMMTGILAIEKGNLQDQVIVSQNATFAQGTRVYLEEGERKSLEDLLYALLLNSGNDASVAIAEKIGGSVEYFTQMMNQKASEIGALNTHFNNPNGLPDPDHYSTAYDLAQIAKYAMHNEEFRKIVATKTKDWPGDKWFGPLINHNKLLWRYQGITGIKTGYTVKAGQCLVASAKRKDNELIAVVLNSKGKGIYSDISQLLDYGFSNFQSEKLITKNQRIDSIKLNGKTIPLLSGEDFTYSKIDGMDNPEKKVKINKDINLPIKKGEVLGHIEITFPEEKPVEIPLVAGKAMTKQGKTTLEKGNTLGLFITAVGILLVLQLGANIRTKKLKRERRLRRLNKFDDNHIV